MPKTQTFDFLYSGKNTIYSPFVDRIHKSILGDTIGYVPLRIKRTQDQYFAYIDVYADKERSDAFNNNDFIINSDRRKCGAPISKNTYLKEWNRAIKFNTFEATRQRELDEKAELEDSW